MSHQGTSRNSADITVPRPDQLKQPQIITLQFADSNENELTFLPGSVYSVWEWFTS